MFYSCILTYAFVVLLIVNISNGLISVNAEEKKKNICILSNFDGEESESVHVNAAGDKYYGIKLRPEDDFTLFKQVQDTNFYNSWNNLALFLYKSEWYIAKNVRYNAWLDGEFPTSIEDILYQQVPSGDEVTRCQWFDKSKNILDALFTNTIVFLDILKIEPCLQYSGFSMKGINIEEIDNTNSSDNCLEEAKTNLQEFDDQIFISPRIV